MEDPNYDPNTARLETFRGRTIEQMNRKELMAALEWAAVEIRRLHYHADRVSTVMEGIREARRVF
jgi:hypothetical protein